MGVNRGGQVELAELPSGGRNVETVLFNDEISVTTAQWDGQNLIVGGEAERGQPIYLYQVSVSGSQATITSTIVLKRRNSRLKQTGQFALQGNRVIEGMSGRRNLGLWRYPQGGELKDVYGNFDFRNGMAVSTAAGNKNR